MAGEKSLPSMRVQPGRGTVAFICAEIGVALAERRDAAAFRVQAHQFFGNPIDRPEGHARVCF